MRLSLQPLTTLGHRARPWLAWSWRQVRAGWSWTLAGLADPMTRPTGLRLLGLGLVAGLGVGWWTGGGVVWVHESPRPVTPPPPGTVWSRVKTTGYCPCWRCCGINATGITSTGIDVHQQPFGIATDAHLLPYHTTLLIPGYGQAITDDTGGAMRRDGAKGQLHLDLRFKTHAEARTWGVQWVWLAIPATTLAAALPGSVN